MTYVIKHIPTGKYVASSTVLSFEIRYGLVYRLSYKDMLRTLKKNKKKAKRYSLVDWANHHAIVLNNWYCNYIYGDSPPIHNPDEFEVEEIKDDI